MGRKNARGHTHIQEKRPTAAVSPPAPKTESAPAAEEARQTGWRWAATLWAIVFLFLMALMVFDLVISLVR